MVAEDDNEVVVLVIVLGSKRKAETAIITMITITTATKAALAIPSLFFENFLFTISSCEFFLLALEVSSKASPAILDI